MTSNNSPPMINDQPDKDFERLYHWGFDFENDWNFPQFSSPKVSKFYHDQNRKFLESPFSPTNQLLKHNAEKEKIRQEKTEKNKALARKRLNDRKNERTELEQYCKRSQGSPLPRISHIKIANQMGYNTCDAAQEYHRYTKLSDSMRKAIFPQKVASIEASGLHNMIQKTNELQKIEEFKQKKIKDAIQTEREKLKKRHKKTQQLENKSDIFKYRELDYENKNMYSINEFGYEKIYQWDMLVEKLSQPKKVDNYKFSKSDLRGMLHATPQPIEPLNTETSIQGHFPITEWRFRRRSS